MQKNISGCFQRVNCSGEVQLRILGAVQALTDLCMGLAWQLGCCKASLWDAAFGENGIPSRSFSFGFFCFIIILQCAATLYVSVF